MKITSIKDVDKFLGVIDQCRGDVHLRSIYGDNFNLHSKLSQYIAISALLGEHGDELELFCDDKEDEYRLINFLNENPQMI